MATPEEQQKKMGQIIAKAWSDESFKKRLLADAATTLKAEGVEIPAGIEVRAVENSDTVVHFVLPPKPAASELSDEDLEKVAGGDCLGSPGWSDTPGASCKGGCFIC